MHKKRSLRGLTRKITYHPQQRVEIFLNLALTDQCRVLLQLSAYVQQQLVTKLKNDQLLPILSKLDPDDATDILQRLTVKRQQTLLSQLSENKQRDIALLLQFDPKTAAGLMSINYIHTDHNSTVTEVAEQIHRHEERTGRFPIILVFANNELIGYLPDHSLVFAKTADRVKQYVQEISAIPHTTDYQSIIDHFVEHPHSKVAVLGENDTILGILYSDDVLRAVHDREASTLYDFAGVSNEETIFDSIRKKVNSRYKWLMINLATSFLAAYTVSLFESTIDKYVLLAVYMPIVAGMGGNAATQTLAVLVRGIALKQIDLATAMPALKRELGAALIHGLINGLLVAAIVMFFNRDMMIALILAIAMVTNLVIAGFFGTLVPLIMTKLGKDPATSATIFITTATDVLGFLAFLGLATILLQ
ncbi:MAG: magnesium transporter [Patescibacteria group bacterium]